MPLARSALRGWVNGGRWEKQARETCADVGDWPGVEGSCCAGGAAACGKQHQGHVLLASSASGSVSLLSVTGAGPSTQM